MSKHILVLTTVPDEQKGKEIARQLLEERLAACVTISSACKSLYWWQERISEEQEYILFIKTKASLYAELEERIRKLHPYKVPEIIALPLTKGFRNYINWIDKETKV